MLKEFKMLTETEVFAVPAKQKTVLVNTSNTPIFLTDAKTDTALVELPTDVQEKVLHALYSLQPGQSKTVSAGLHKVTIPFNGLAVLQIERAEKPVKVEPPVIVPPATFEPLLIPPATKAEE